jgi:lipopolysaccharide export system permease protein
MALIANPTDFNLGELLWRCALPIMALLLMLLAIPLGFVNPRAGRSANLLIALLLFIVYSNMVSVFQAQVVQNRLSFFIAWWPIHLLVIGLIAFLFSWRLQANSRYHPRIIYAYVKRAVFQRKAASQ